MTRHGIRLGALAAALLAARPAAAQETRESLLEKASSATGAARTAAMERLGMLREERALPVLRAALGDGAVEVRRAAIGALGAFGRADLVADLGPLAADPDPRIAGDAARALASAGLPAVPPLLAALRHESGGVREAAEAALVRACGISARAAVVEEAWKRSKGDRFAFHAAVLALDAGPRAHREAVRALPDEPRSAEPLVRTLGSAGETVRAAARERLERLACRRLDDDGWRAWRLAEPEGPVVAWRAAALADPANPARLAAARALAVPDRGAVAPLLAAAHDPALASTALDALTAATGLLARPLPAWDAWWAANRGRSRLEWLQAALLDASDAPNRAAAARSLAGERDRRSVEYLLACALPDDDPVVRGAADSSLAALIGARPEGAEGWAGLWKRRRAEWK